MGPTDSGLLWSRERKDGLHLALIPRTPEEMLATKLRALLQRDKGRDLLDRWHEGSVQGIQRELGYFRNVSWGKREPDDNRL